MPKKKQDNKKKVKAEEAEAPTKTRQEEIEELETRLKTLKSQDQNQNKNQYLIPLSIIIAGMFVAGAVYFSGGGAIPTQLGGNNQGAPTGGDNTGGAAAGDISVESITAEDHIRGDLDAPVKVVEFSDFECPFCQRIHPNLKRVVDEYDGQVAWVYRHFPLDSIHPQATPAAQASECVAELGGNDAFWEFADALFNNQGSLGESFYVSTASQVGVSSSAFQSCFDSQKYASKVQDHAQQAQAAGGKGTPYSIVIAPNGKTFAINGAQPYASIKSTIDLALQEK
ncbi:MAG: DsbA family protein [Candidatus Spechtbacterales bacterium]|nr:DsbA family protein [Candidatus Spechtbacterales bacterium]